jgi:tripartite-type tricarboxylate transporter receptor subunit TctC
MKFPRRRFLHLAAGAATLPTASRLARAQAYPTRPVRIVIGFGAGGAGDIVARLIGQRLSERLGQQFLVENRPGAGSNIATEAVVNARPDGHTLLLSTSSNAINATLYEKLNFNFMRDIVPIASIFTGPEIMEVNPSFPAKTFPDFIAYAKTNPGKINYASPGIGSPGHVTSELLKMMAGIDMIHVPYRTPAELLTEMIGGQVQLLFDPVASSIEYIKTGKLRALAVTTTNRLDVLPDTPSIDEFLPGFEATVLAGLCAPKNTPTGIVDRLNREINALLADQKIKSQLEGLGLRVASGSAADYSKLIADETQKWAKVVKFSGAKAD